MLLKRGSLGKIVCRKGELRCFKCLGDVEEGKGTGLRMLHFRLSGVGQQLCSGGARARLCLCLCHRTSMDQSHRIQRGKVLKHASLVMPHLLMDFCPYNDRPHNVRDVRTIPGCQGQRTPSPALPIFRLRYPSLLSAGLPFGRQTMRKGPLLLRRWKRTTVQQQSWHSCFALKTGLSRFHVHPAAR